MGIIPKSGGTKGRIWDSQNLAIWRGGPGKLELRPLSAGASWLVLVGVRAMMRQFFFCLIYLFLAALGLCGGEQGLLFVVVHGLLIVVASLVVEHGL